MKKLAAATVALLLSVVPAAAYPHSIVGNWYIIGNQSTGLMVISSQEGTRPCRTITGRLVNDVVSYPFTGFYYPSTGRIIFATLRNGAVYQVYSGNTGYNRPTDRMAGTFADFSENQAEYPWSASKNK